MNKKRLALLAVELVKNAVNPRGAKFDLSLWTKGARKGRAIGCGTTACAFGLAALLPAFKREGLFLDGRTPAVMVSKHIADLRGWEYNFGDVRKGKVLIEGIEAAAYFFGITDYEANKLFTPGDQYAGEPTVGALGEMTVARKIVELIS